jgi:hypothetical protein
VLYAEDYCKPAAERLRGRAELWGQKQIFLMLLSYWNVIDYLMAFRFEMKKSEWMASCPIAKFRGI